MKLVQYFQQIQYFPVLPGQQFLQILEMLNQQFH
jgi:hypothetical protein